MSLIMTKQERETFLADVHVGIISISEDGRGPLTGTDLVCLRCGRRSTNHDRSGVAKGSTARAGRQV